MAGVHTNLASGKAISPQVQRRVPLGRWLFSMYFLILPKHVNVLVLKRPILSDVLAVCHWRHAAGASIQYCALTIYHGIQFILLLLHSHSLRSLRRSCLVRPERGRSDGWMDAAGAVADAVRRVDIYGIAWSWQGEGRHHDGPRHHASRHEGASRLWFDVALMSPRTQGEKIWQLWRRHGIPHRVIEDGRLVDHACGIR